MNESNPLGRVRRDPNDRVGETLDRLRRMETKITLIMEKLDLDTQAQKPKWLHDSVVDIPSMDIRLKDIFEAVPESWRQFRVFVTHKGRQVCSLYIDS